MDNIFPTWKNVIVSWLQNALSHHTILPIFCDTCWPDKKNIEWMVERTPGLYANYVIQI